MTKELWLNLPVKDLERSKAFYKKVGFSFKDEHGSDTMLAMMVGEKKCPVMLFLEDTFRHVVELELSDATKTAQIMISFDASSKEEVDEIAKRVQEAGGNLFSRPATIQGWMYGCAFADPDGHRWNALFMES